jgi:hypothetical protein
MLPHSGALAQPNRGDAGPDFASSVSVVQTAAVANGDGEPVEAR